MGKNSVFLLVLGMVAAFPCTALAGADWAGYTDDWYGVANWSSDPVNIYQTEKASIDPADMAALGGTFMPVIDSADSTQFGFARIRNSAVVTQTGGNHRWMNGTGTSNWGLNIYGGALLDMSGGKHTADRLSLGLYNAVQYSGAGTINVWGTGNFRLRQNPYVPGLVDIFIDDGSVIDIRDSGVMEVDLAIKTKTLGYMAAGKIVAGAPGTSLATYDDASYTYIYVIPEPGTMLLLCFGLGSLALIRRK